MDHPNPMHRVGEQTERAGEAPLPAPRAAARPRSIKALRLGDSARMVDQSPSSAAPPDDTARKRRFQEWPGRNHFLCGGRVLLGVHVGRLRTTFALLSLTWAMHAFLHARDVNALCLAALALALAEYVSLASAAASDPGIIPRWPAEPQLERLTPHEKLSLRYCTTCRLLRPARAKHCRYCDNCVDRFDHHCPWTGNCVGLRNYRSFLSFVAATCAGTALIAAGAIGYLRDHRKRVAAGDGGAFGGALDDCGRPLVAGALASWCCGVGSLLLALLGLHGFLVSRGQTTNEFLRDELRGTPRCALAGVGADCADLWCGFAPPSRLLPMHELAQASDQTAIEGLVRRAIEHAAGLRCVPAMPEQNAPAPPPAECKTPLPALEIEEGVDDSAAQD